MSKLICVSSQKCEIISSVMSNNAHPNLFMNRNQIMEVLIY